MTKSDAELRAWIAKERHRARPSFAEENERLLRCAKRLEEAADAVADVLKDGNGWAFEGESREVTPRALREIADRARGMAAAQSSFAPNARPYLELAARQFLEGKLRTVEAFAKIANLSEESARKYLAKARKNKRLLAKRSI